MSYLRIKERPTPKPAAVLLDPMAQALAFTQEADDLPPDPHGKATAAELVLRRKAHLALCFTPEFKEHRRRLMRRAPEADFREEYRQPSGDLVRKLAALRASTPRRHIVMPGTFTRGRL